MSVLENLGNDGYHVTIPDEILQLLGKLGYRYDGGGYSFVDEKGDDSFSCTDEKFPIAHNSSTNCTLTVYGDGKWEHTHQAGPDPVLLLKNNEDLSNEEKVRRFDEVRKLLDSFDEAVKKAMEISPTKYMETVVPTPSQLTYMIDVEVTDPRKETHTGETFDTLPEFLGNLHGR